MTTEQIEAAEAAVPELTQAQLNRLGAEVGWLRTHHPSMEVLVRIAHAYLVMVKNLTGMAPEQYEAAFGELKG